MMLTSANVRCKSWIPRLRADCARQTSLCSRPPKGLDIVNAARSIVEGLRDPTGEAAALFRLQQDR